MTHDLVSLFDVREECPLLSERPKDNPLIAYLHYRHDCALQLAEELSLMAARCGLYRDLPHVSLETTCCWIQAAQHLCQPSPRPKDTGLSNLLRAMGRADPPYTELRNLAPWVRSVWLAAAQEVQHPPKS